MNITSVGAGNDSDIQCPQHMAIASSLFAACDKVEGRSTHQQLSEMATPKVQLYHKENSSVAREGLVHAIYYTITTNTLTYLLDGLMITRDTMNYEPISERYYATHSR